jgi:N-acetylgalactosamine kinase
VRRLLEGFAQGDNDLALLVGPKERQPSCGRIWQDAGGRPVAIVETTDIALAFLVRELETTRPADGTWSCRELQALIARHFPHEKKARTACGALYETAWSQDRITAERLESLLEPLRERTWVEWEEPAGRQRLAACEVEERADYVNLGTYLFKAPALFESLATLNRDNAQGEEYLTDAIHFLANARDAAGRPCYRVAAVTVEAPEDALTFNTPEELAEVERRLRLTSRNDLQLVDRPQLLHARSLRSVAEWHLLFSLNTEPVRRFTTDTYGPELALQEAKRTQYLRALDCYAEHYGPQDQVFLVRSPGRLNLLGRHVDHRGGYTNVVAISEEVVMVCGPREDDLVELHNTARRQFREGRFSIAEQAAALGGADWHQVLDNAQTLATVSEGRWVNYFKAAALRLQAHFPDIALQGLNLVTHGTIPMGAGLSSSSALVVGASEALIARNCLPVHAHLEVDLCGEGEWFVGTRGGSGDHAAIKFGRRGQVVRFSFLPFRVCGSTAFLPGYEVVVCNSGLQAKKSENARDTFNSRVLGYVVGEILFRRLYPQYAERVQHLRDLTCEKLGVSLAELYELLKGLPQELTVDELWSRYGPGSAQEVESIEAIRATLTRRDQPLLVRGVVLFGLAECERSARCLECLARGDAEGLGNLWYLSHDGDRIVEHDDELRPRPWNYVTDDAYLDRLLGWLRSGDPELVAQAQLHQQPGGYACSTPEIDKIVDTARTVPGVKGAQMAGAGLGGCVMILVEEAASGRLVRTLAEQGWAASPYEFVEGAGLVVV